jgi:nucleotidyltransferase substrate binding protein (TIGR01987 family)
MDTKQFEDAVARLGEMLEVYGRIDTLPPLLQDTVKESLLQRFEYTQEMAWKTAKRYLTEVEGYAGAMGPRTVIRVCGELGILDPEEWFLYLDARHDTSHDYSESKAKAVLDAVMDFYQEVHRLLEILQFRIKKNGGT